MVKKTAIFISRSGNGKYKTIRESNGKIGCSCKGWIYNRKCWHSERAKVWA